MRIKISLIASLLLIINVNAFATVNFIPRLTLREEYSDNLDLTPDNEKSDWITSIAPGAMLEFRGRTSGLFLDYEPSLVMYSRYTEYDTWRHRGRVGVWAELSRHTHFEAENVSIYTEEPISDYAEESDLEIDRTIRESRNHYFLNTTSTSLSYQFGPENFLDIGYTYDFITNEDEDLDDTKRHEPFILFRYWPIENEWGTETELRYRKGVYEIEDDFDFWTAGLLLIRRFSRNIDGSFRYRFSNMAYDGESEEYQLHEIGPGFRYVVDEDTRLSVDLLYLYRNREISDDQSEILLTSEILKRWVIYRNYIEVVANSGYRPDTFGNGDNGFNIFAEATARYRYSFSRQMEWDIFGIARYDKYIDQDPEYIDNTFGVGTGVSRQIFSWATLRLGYSHRQVLSEVYDREYAENRVIITLTMMAERGRGALHTSPRGRRQNFPSQDSSGSDDTNQSRQRD